MKILTVSDAECSALWDYYAPGKLEKYDLILSAGDLKADYLTFLVTMARSPLMYIHGNHDERYAKRPPEGCDCIDDKLMIYKGLRILGLGGCRQYRPGAHQYTEAQMRRRIRKLRAAVKLAGGVDIVVAHAAPAGIGDAEDIAHRGFETFLELIDTWKPKFFVHGHMHMNYSTGLPRVEEYAGTKVINCCERYELELEDPAQISWGFWEKLRLLFIKNIEKIDW